MPILILLLILLLLSDNNTPTAPVALDQPVTGQKVWVTATPSEAQSGKFKIKTSCGSRGGVMYYKEVCQ